MFEWKDTSLLTRNNLIEKALELGFEDVGFTTAEPFGAQLVYLRNHQEEYGWTEKVGLGLMTGTDPKAVMPSAKSIIVLMESYFREAFPPALEGHFGRCYLDDDRVTKDGLALRIKAFRSFLRENGIDSKVPFNLPHRAAAMRAGRGTLGKNALLYSNRAALMSSWVLPITVVVDREFAPDSPAGGLGCPDWCRNVCVAACPTRAIKGNGEIDPRKCISFMTYFGKEITPRELREPMGLYVYGCDRCQNVCPRNLPWLSRARPVNPRVEAKAKDFDLRALLHMDAARFQSRVWPHMFYMSPNNLWKWKMNVARAMGNSRDESYVPDLIRAYDENDDARVRGMLAWALGRIGGRQAKDALERFFEGSDGAVRGEIEATLGNV
jgi:epoxyqueuosine reductase